MVTKVLKKKEIEIGFVYIPVEKRAELLDGLTPPFATKLNDLPAKWDNKGRLRCSKLLKNKFPVDAEVEVIKNNSGFEIRLNGKDNVPSTVRTIQAANEQIKVDKAASLNEALDVNDNTVLLKDFPAPEKTWYKVLEGDCIDFFNKGIISKVDLTFFDPPYLQGKEYRYFDDSQSADRYWNWIKRIVEGVYKNTSDGGCLYFMHREKNAEIILRIIRECGWNFQNLIIWRKKTSAVPIETRFSKQYQIIAYAIKGSKPRVFNKIRIDPPPLPEHKYKHENGVYLTDVWDDIRELTSGYFAGDEAYRDLNGNRTHIQQTPVALLLRIILSSSMPSDIVFDPTAGTGTAAVVAKQLRRSSIAIEIDPAHVELINNRLKTLRPSDNISTQYAYYRCTENLSGIWQSPVIDSTTQKKLI